MDNSETKKSGCVKRGIQIFLVLFGVGAATAILHGLFSTPEERAREGQQQSQNAAALDQAGWADANRTLGETAVKKILKDPDSAQFRDVTVVVPNKYDPKRLGVVCGSVNAKNSFGGYSGFKSFMVIAGVPMVEDGKTAFVRLWNRECAKKDAL